MRPDQSLRRFQIIKLAIFEPVEHRREALVHLGLIGGADRRHSATVKGIGESDQLDPFGIASIAGILVVGTRCLYRTFNCFGAGIG